MDPLAHLAVWAALYTTGAVACFSQLRGLGLHPLTLLYSWCTALCVYLLDRVKLRDVWLDPADRAAHPARFHFLAARSGLVRVLAAASGLAAVAVGLSIHPLLALLVPLSCIGVLVYAARPRAQHGMPRPKDIFIVKNIITAGAIASFAAMVAIVGEVAKPGLIGGASSDPSALLGAAAEFVAAHRNVLILAFLHLIGRVFADAVICDLDDEASDRAHRTATLPTAFGRRDAWLIASGLRLVLAAWLLCWPTDSGPALPRTLWAAVTVATTVGLRAWNPPRVREAVDLRLALEVLVVAALLRVLP
jgi:4-hydroxybenzoate polyprenyltransferase